jgi:peptidoglycan/LPS O-acetylase OafA/YrhL
MIEFLSGALTLAYLIAALFFLRFWRRTADRLFLAFTVAFVLFALNQGLAHTLAIYHEPTSFIYALRVLGFVLILIAIVDKNFFSGKSTR